MRHFSLVTKKEPGDYIIGCHLIIVLVFRLQYNDAVLHGGKNNVVIHVCKFSPCSIAVASLSNIIRSQHTRRNGPVYWERPSLFIINTWNVILGSLIIDCSIVSGCTTFITVTCVLISDENLITPTQYNWLFSRWFRTRYIRRTESISSDDKSGINNWLICDQTAILSIRRAFYEIPNCKKHGALLNAVQRNRRNQ